MFWQNLKTNWIQHLGHSGVAILAGYLLTTDYVLAGLALTAAQHIRQVGGFWEKRDTLSIDLFYCQGGLVVGIVAGIVVDLACRP